MARPKILNEDKRRIKKSVSLKQEMWNQVKEKASKEKKTVSRLVEQALEKMLNGK